MNVVLKKNYEKHQELCGSEISQKPRESIETCSNIKIQAIDHIRWKSHCNPYGAN